MKLKDTLSKIESTKMDFFNNNPNIFKEYVELCNEDDDIKSKYYGKNAISEKGIQDYIIMQSIREVKPRFPSIFEEKEGMLIPLIEDELTEKGYEGIKKKFLNGLNHWKRL